MQINNAVVQQAEADSDKSDMILHIFTHYKLMIKANLNLLQQIQVHWIHPHKTHWLDRSIGHLVKLVMMVTC